MQNFQFNIELSRIDILFIIHVKLINILFLNSALYVLGISVKNRTCRATSLNVSTSNLIKQLPMSTWWACRKN